MRTLLPVIGIVWLSLACAYPQNAVAQDADQPKIILITLDGFRWQELFTGADPALIAHEEYVADTAGLKKKFWRDTPQARRKALLPFIWNKVTAIGTIHGNRAAGSKVDLTNTMRFSYPGYNEILTGAADDEHINSNSKTYNPNITVLERLNKMPAYKNAVAAFASWDVFPYIINDKRSDIPVNAGFDTSRAQQPTDIEQFLNKAQPRTPSPWGSVRLDMFTHNYALEYMKREQPDIVYIGYGETDDFAHNGNYQAYLNSAHSTDAFLQELWEYTQHDAYYKDKTTFIITTDHGRGTKPLDTWRSHGSDIEGSEEVWLIAYGSTIEAKGEITTDEQLFSTKVVEMINAITQDK